VPLSVLINEQETDGAESLDRHLYSLDDLLAALPVVTLSEGQTRRFSHGNPVSDGLDLGPGQYRVKDDASGRFLGVGEVATASLLQPARLVVSKTG
jgi:tRNA U55 pseudouridine synthase TruB